MSDDEIPSDIFAEPDGYFEELKGKSVSIDRVAGKGALELTLAAKHSLWGHEVWNASKFLAESFDKGELVVDGLTTLELGAGAGLASFIAAFNGATKVVVTDYETASDATLTDALRANLLSLRSTLPPGVVAVEGCVWGTDPTRLLAHVASIPRAHSAAAAAPASAAAAATAAAAPRRFDRIILADLLFNRHCHRQLLATCAACLEPDGVVWVSYSHHDPQKAALDNAFFTLAVEPTYGFTVTKVRDIEFERDTFVENDGLDDQRRIVHFYELTFAHSLPPA